jgi:hypothetical protein
VRSGLPAQPAIALAGAGGAGAHAPAAAGPSDGAPLAHFLPPVGEGPAAALQRRAALASTLMAGLELNREGALTLDQTEGFGEIQITAARSGAMGAAT